MKMIPEESIRHLQTSYNYSNRLQDLLETAEPFRVSTSVNSPVRENMKIIEAQLIVFQESKVVASAPEVIAAYAMQKQSKLLPGTLDTVSREYMGEDTHGRVGKKGRKVRLVVHSQGLMTQEEFKHVAGGSDANPRELYMNRMDDVLSGEECPLYHTDDVAAGAVEDPFNEFAVWFEEEEFPHLAQQVKTKEAFMRQPYMLARAGSPDYLEKFYDRYVGSDLFSIHATVIPTHTKGRPQVAMTRIDAAGGSIEGKHMHQAEHFIKYKTKLQVKKQ